LRDPELECTCTGRPEADPRPAAAGVGPRRSAWTGSLAGRYTRRHRSCHERPL